MKTIYPNTSIVTSYLMYILPIYNLRVQVIFVFSFFFVIYSKMDSLWCILLKILINAYRCVPATTVMTENSSITPRIPSCCPLQSTLPLPPVPQDLREKVFSLLPLSLVSAVGLCRGLYQVEDVFFYSQFAKSVFIINGY